MDKMPGRDDGKRGKYHDSIFLKKSSLESQASQIIDKRLARNSNESRKDKSRYRTSV